MVLWAIWWPAHPDNQQADTVHHQRHHGHHRHHGAVHKQRVGGEVFVGLVEALLLKILCGKGANDHQAREMLAADQVQLVDELLHFLEARQRHYEQHQNNAQHHNQRQKQNPRHGHALGKPHNKPAMPMMGAKAHRRRPHGEKCLHLGDVVGGACDEAGGGELVQLAGGEVGYPAEHIARRSRPTPAPMRARQKPGRNGARP